MMKNDQVKRIVFCDTMIWYYVKDGMVKFDKTKFDYYGSGINIGDFLGSDKLERSDARKKEVQDAILSLDKNSKDVICVDPMTAAASNLLGIPISSKEHQQYQKIYRTLVQLANNQTKGIYGPGVDALLNQKKNFQKSAINTKKQFNKLFKQKRYSNQEKEEIIEANVAQWLLANFNTLYNVNYTLEQITNWDSVTIFIKAYKRFVINAYARNQPEENSMIDMLQLLYIRKGGPALVWTTEKKVLNKIRSEFTLEECKNIIYQDYLGEDYSKFNAI